ncbi:MAG: DUF3810 domain-containing protein [Flavobacteriaceae bacterium]|nr:DUF3810 domain-containing protein [Flavobacteriaceae bacterium]
MQKKSKLILALLFPIQILVLQVLKRFPEFIETYYSTGLFPILSKTTRYLFGWIPFSIGDIFYLLIVLYAVRWIYKNIRRIKFDFKNFSIDIFATLSIVYLAFNLLWGLNYYRIPLHKKLAIKTDYTTEQLIETTKRLIKKSNKMHRKLGFADSVKIESPYDHKQIFNMTLNGYENLAEKHPNLAYSPLSLKKSNWSLGLTYMGYSGYYNPFSGEAQVNGLIKLHKFPVVSCHEQAHQIGYAAENEANFIAALATLNNDDEFIQYTGYIFALRYCVNEIARRDLDAYHDLLETINSGILKSYKEMREFWKSYDNPFEVISKLFWDQFLKANNQSKGIKSYSYMVALIVNYYENEPF